MSVKDKRFGAPCPICGDYLVGSDDAHEVFDGIKEAAAAGVAGNCGLCGEDCSLEDTLRIANGPRPDTGCNPPE